MAGRRQKAELKALLQQDDWNERLQAFLAGDSTTESPARSCLGPLFSFLLLDGVVRWRAASAIGLAVARICEDKCASRSGGPGGMEAGRDILRRFMWNLNEESGNVAWGTPEAMAECLVQQPKLAEEFHNILISYIDNTIDHGLWLELPLLRRGAVWGVARLCCARPELMARAGLPLLAALDDAEDAEIPGLAAWGLGCLGRTWPDWQQASQALHSLAESHTPVTLYLDGVLTQTTVGELARQAAAKMKAWQVGS